MTIRLKIVETLRDRGPMTAEQLAQVVSRTLNYTRYVCARLSDDGLIHVVDKIPTARKPRNLWDIKHRSRGQAPNR